jgi:hypothetical protein
MWGYPLQVVAISAMAALVASTDIMISKPNERWKESGCAGMDLSLVYGAIRRSVQYSIREVYIPLESSWMDQILWDHSKVEVVCSTYEALPQVSLPTLPDATSEAADDQTYQILYVQVPPDNFENASSFDNNIDAFLTGNPCWTLIHDPPYAEKGHVHTSHHPEHTGNIKTLIESAILVRLPSYPYAMTCKFNEYVRARNFPETCPEKDDLFMYEMTNFGLGGEGNKLVRTMQYLLWNGKCWADVCIQHECTQTHTHTHTHTHTYTHTHTHTHTHTRV